MASRLGRYTKARLNELKWMDNVMNDEDWRNRDPLHLRINTLLFR